MTFKLRQSWPPKGWSGLFSAKVWLIGLLIPNALAQSSGKFVPTGDLNAPRIGHTATLLHDGRVLIAGGNRVGSGIASLSSAELYDPTTGTFSPAGNMTLGRSGHTATLLLDGRVLITGGFTNGSLSASAELYDPATGAFSATGSMLEGRSWHAATLLSTGNVLISGTEDRNLELYDPATGFFTPTGYVNGSAYGVPATRLLNGDVLLGGYHYGPDAAVYDTVTGTIRGLQFPDLVHVEGYSETLLANGKVLLAGGLTNGIVEYYSTYLFDPKNKTFQTTGSLLDARGFHTATLLPGGLVLIAGGYTGNPVEKDYASAELYNPASGTFAKAGAMTRPRAEHTATLLLDGRVLMVGGELISGASGGPESTAELYVPPWFPDPACGKYQTVEGYCRRVAILPWYAAVLDQWETDLDLSSSFSTVRFGYSMSTAFTYDGVGHNMLLEASDRLGRSIAEAVNGIQGAYSARILGGEDCTQGNCQAVPSLGSLVFNIDGPNAAALDSAFVRATHKLLASDGSVLGQANAPVVFRDQASSKWSAAITDTPLSKQAQPDATVVSFAVANLAAEAQVVNVKVFDGSGKLVGSAVTPVLTGSPSLGPPYNAADGVGGVYAVTLSGLLGADLVPSAGDTMFRGTVTFEGAAGGKIAPLIVQMNWPSITSIPANPE